VQERSPVTEKAGRLLGFQATTSLGAILDEVVPWIAGQIEVGKSKWVAAASVS